MKSFVIVLALVMFGVSSIIGDGQAPTLTDVQKLQCQNLLQRLEIAQLKAAQAQADFNQASIALSLLVKQLSVEGFDLDLQRLEYVKRAEPKE